MFNNKTILITGGTGSWGHELLHQILTKNVKKVKIYSRGELNQWKMAKNLGADPRVEFIVGDVRDQDRLNTATQGVDIVFHLAALKHVPICEKNPFEAVQTNIVGTQNVINSCILNNVEIMVDVSTDKAVDPFNLYGVTKSCAEKLCIAANNLDSRCKFVCVRGGNVLGTNGSVIPLFHEQILSKGEVTVTDGSMTRFLMRLSEAINLLLYSVQNCIGGEIFVIKMSSFTVDQLVNVMSKKLCKDVKINVIGARPGEKYHEVLVSRYEGTSTYDLGSHFVIIPNIMNDKIGSKYNDLPSVGYREFASNNCTKLSDEKLGDILELEGWCTNSLTGRDTSILGKWN